MIPFEAIIGIIGIACSVIVAFITFGFKFYGKTKDFEDEYKDKIKEIANNYRIQIVESIKKLCKLGKEQKQEFSENPDDEYSGESTYYKLVDVVKNAKDYENWIKKINYGKLLLRKIGDLFYRLSILIFLLFTGILIYFVLQINEALLLIIAMVVLIILWTWDILQVNSEYQELIKEIDGEYESIKLKYTNW